MEENRKTWKPVTAGVLNIITAVFSLFGAITIVVMMAVIDVWAILIDVIPSSEIPLVESMVNIILVGGLVLEIFHVIAVTIGGIFALQRRRWGWALSGSIVAIVANFPFGLASTILIAVSRDEFDKPAVKEN